GAWGETLRVSELDAPTHQFVGFEPDPATGWYFMGARVYNPALRRWLSPDPLLLAAPQVDSAEGLELNLYSYTGNNPVGFIDPTGNIRIASADYDSRAVGDDRRGQIAGSPPHFSPFVQGVSAAVMTGAMGMLAIAASGPVDVANAVDSAGIGNYAPAALSAGMAALPIGRLGRFVPRNRSMSVRAAKYQSQITGTAANIEFNLKGVDFDGLKDGVLLEAKGPGYAKFISKKTGEFEDWFDGATKLLDQARRQVNAAKGAKVEWHVAEEKAASTIKELLKSQRVKGINVKHIEPVD
ncbi:RHS repeat-associated core domain-containing protein, partial [Bradymonas sediminis]